MWILKVIRKSDKMIYTAMVYNRIENAIASIACGEIFDYVPFEERNHTKPEIVYHSEDNDGNADDFEFRYEDYIVYIGRVVIEDAK